MSNDTCECTNIDNSTSKPSCQSKLANRVILTSKPLPPDMAARLAIIYGIAIEIGRQRAEAEQHSEAAA